nr:hypothetical protein [Trentepohlia sp. YN1317]
MFQGKTFISLRERSTKKKNHVIIPPFIRKRSEENKFKQTKQIITYISHFPYIFSNVNHKENLFFLYPVVSVSNKSNYDPFHIKTSINMKNKFYQGNTLSASLFLPSHKKYSPMTSFNEPADRNIERNVRRRKKNEELKGFAKSFLPSRGNEPK